MQVNVQLTLREEWAYCPLIFFGTVMLYSMQQIRVLASGLLSFVFVSKLH